MAFELAPLPYEVNALEPYIDAKTMEIHYGKHHATYVTNLNNALKDHSDLQTHSVEDLITNLDKLPEAVKMVVRNNGGGHWNHTFFWNLMAPNAAKASDAALLSAINNSFGSVDEMLAKLKAAALARFGSGWAWVTADKAGALAISSTPNQDSPLMEGKHSILGVDVWEHAYYLNYQNKRADYLDNWFKVISWDAVSKLFAARPK